MIESRHKQLASLAGWLERHPYILPAIILVIAGIFRFYNLNWDNGHQLHPDERGIYMLVNGSSNNPPLSWPTSISQFLSVKDPTGGSPLNPHYFAYGSLPYYLLAFVAGSIATIGQHVTMLSSWATANTYGGLPPVGRGLSALLTLFSVFLLFLLGRRVFGYWTGVLAMALSGFTVLDIQLAHFYQSDTVLLPLVLLTLLGAVSMVQTGRKRAYVWTGIVLGAALATKTTALVVVAPVGAAAVLAAWNGVSFPRHGHILGRLRRHYLAIAGTLNANLQWLLITYLVSAAAFAFFEPYGILDRSQLLYDVQQQNSLLVTNNPPFGVPYTLQYAHTTPYLFQIQNLLFWSLGLPLAIAGFAGVLFAVFRGLRARLPAEQAVLLLWILPYFLLVGTFFAKFNRYMLPITPIITLFGAAFLVWLARRARTYVKVAGVGAIVVVATITFLYALAYMNIYTSTNTRVGASRWIFAHIPKGSLIAQEGPWDETLPLDENGMTGSPTFRFTNDSSGGPLLNPYAGEFTLQDENTKISNFTKVLTTADYIVMSSERMDRSVAKNPDRLPIAYRYYQLLFSNRLNFRLVAHFQQHPQLGPVVVHDYSADESFHVYDHPDVRIFKRVSAISPQRVRTLLTTGLPSFPYEDPATLPAILRPVNPAPDSRLMLSSRQWQKDQSGPTLDQMFPPNGFAMRHPLVVWLILLEILGLIAFPLTFLLFGRLIDRGFVMAKTLGLILTGYLVWIVVSLGMWEYTRALVIASAVALFLISGGLAYRLRRRLIPAIRARWKYMLAGEFVFLLAFAFFVLLRMYYPDLGHQFSPVGPQNMGAGRMGEKQMELAFVNAIARSRVFPPLDPFFSHGYINYYYYGFFLVSTLCKLTQIAPSTGFNLAIATFGALLLASVFSVVFTLTRRITPGVLAALFVGVIGNLDGGWQMIQGLMQVGTIHSSFPVTGGLVDTLSGLQQVIFNHQSLPQIDFWGPTRIFPAGAISEFPYFTYLFADLHPHLMAYPMCALAIAVAVNLLRGGYARLGRRLLALLLAGVVLGSIAVTNPWDFPTYLIVVGLGALISAFVIHRRPGTRSRVLSLIFRPAAWMGGIAVLSLLLYLPFKTGYQTVFTTGIGLVRDISPDLLLNTGICPATQKVCPQAVHDALVTPLRLFLEHFGLFLFVLVSYLLLLVNTNLRLTDRVRRWITRLQFVSYYRERPARLLHARRVVMSMRSPDRVRGGDHSFLWSAAILILGMIVLRYYLLAFLTLMLALAIASFSWFARIRLRSAEMFVLALTGAAAALSFLTQIFFVKDFLAGGAQFRMNTTFKFYNQVWVLFAIAAATALYYLMARQIVRPRPRAVPILSAGAAEPDDLDVIGHAHEPRLLDSDPDEVPGKIEAAHARAPHGPTGTSGAQDLHSAARVRRWRIKPAPASGSGSHVRLPWTRPLILLERRWIWCLALAGLLFASFVYTVGGTASRETMRSNWLPQNSVPATLDGMAFMKVAYPGEYTAISWLNSHVSGAPVIAEAGGTYYDWRSRVSMFTGLPSIINGIHEDEQRWSDELNPQELCSGARNPDTCSLTTHARIDDLTTLYSSPSISEAWRVIHTYGVRYIFKGFAEQVCIQSANQCYSKAGLAKFDRMVGHGLKVAFRTGGVTIYEVTGR